MLTSEAAALLEEVLGERPLARAASQTAVIRRAAFGILLLATDPRYAPTDRWYATSEEDGGWALWRPGEGVTTPFPDLKQLLIYVRLTDQQRNDL